MISLKQYILEATSTDSEKNFFEKIFQNMEELEDNIEIDPKTLKKPNEGIFDQEDINDGFFQKLITSKQGGLPISTKIMKNESLLQYDDKQNAYEVIYTPYIGNVDGKDYLVGLLAFDVKSVLVKGYVNIISIESAKIVKNDSDICKGIFESFINFISEQLKDREIVGVCARPVLPAISTILRSCGMKTFTKNKEYMIYDF